MVEERGSSDRPLRDMWPPLDHFFLHHKLIPDRLTTTWQPLAYEHKVPSALAKWIFLTVCCAVFDAYQNPNILGRQCKWFSVAQELGQIMVLKRGRGRKQDVFSVNASRCHAGPRSKRKKAQGGIRTSDYRPLAPRDDHQAILARTTFVLIASRLDG